MFQSSIPYHETGNFKSHRTFLPDDQYGIALDNIVKGCSDILILSPIDDNETSESSSTISSSPPLKKSKVETRIFSGRRCVQPQPDWWFIGGRIMPGETPIQAGQRLLSRELGLPMDSMTNGSNTTNGTSRFKPVCAQAFAFEMRQQPPQNHGTTDVQFCFSYRLRDSAEKKLVEDNLDKNEYSEAGWKLPSEILEGNFHPALKYAVGCWLAGEALEELREFSSKDNEGDDAQVAKLAREFLKRSKEADDILKKNDYKLESKELNYETTVTTKF